MINELTQYVNSMSGWSLIIFANEKIQTRSVFVRSSGTAHTSKVLNYLYTGSKLNATGRISKYEMGSKLVKRRYVNHFVGEAHLTSCKHLAPVSRKTHHTAVPGDVRPTPLKKKYHNHYHGYKFLDSSCYKH
jgi:hypothetical protein